MNRRLAIFLITVLALAGCVGDPGLAPESIPTAVVQLPTATRIPPTSTPTATPEPSPGPSTDIPWSNRVFSIGHSVEGRDIQAWQFGTGPTTLVLVGGIHGGYEANGAQLAEMLASTFRSDPGKVLPGMSVVIIPEANPDGLARGTDANARVNANGVDLNRNWGCDWSPTATWSIFEIYPGPAPFSEPETQALRDYFLDQMPDAVIFYHSAYGGVFTGSCGAAHPPADWLGNLLSETTGYPYEVFDQYDVTGDASNWLAEQGIPAAIIELTDREDPEFERNLRGVMAVQCHFVQEAGRIDSQNDSGVGSSCP